MVSAKERSIDGRRADEVGQFLHRFRKTRSLTLEDLATASGISKSTLSRIENGKLSPTFDVMCRIARGLDVPVERLFAGPDRERLRGWRSVTRMRERTRRAMPHYALELLCNDVSGRAFLMFAATITARSLDEFDALTVHGGEEQLVVLSGSVEVHTEHYEPIELFAGDSIAFDSRMGHAIISTSPEDANVLWVSADADATAEKKALKRLPAIRETMRIKT